MARIYGLDESALDLRRAAVTVAVVAAHVVLVMVMLRSAGHSADVVDITLFALPIIPEDRLRELVHVQKPLLSRAPGSAPRRAAVARESATEQHMESSLAAHAGAASEPPPPIDWRAEIETSVHALEQHDRIESGRRSLAGPTQHALSASPRTPACPFERCEPGWGANLGVFESQHSKAGRIETLPSNRPITSDGALDVTGNQVIQWINNWCYNVLIAADRLSRGATRCVFPLAKTPARGDLFDHMNEGQPPRSHDTDAPWLSFGLSVGASR